MRAHGQWFIQSIEKHNTRLSCKTLPSTHTPLPQGGGGRGLILNHSGRQPRLFCHDVTCVVGIKGVILTPLICPNWATADWRHGFRPPLSPNHSAIEAAESGRPTDDEHINDRDLNEQEV